MTQLDAVAGTYVIVMQADKAAQPQVGSIGSIKINVGHYLYIGSAFGPGGIKARVSRHCKTSKTKHWHLDYLREYLEPVEVWFTHDKTRREHEWAGLLASQPKLKSVASFGCSDCRCNSHLFFQFPRPRVAQFRKVVADNITNHSAVLSCSPHEISSR